MLTNFSEFYENFKTKWTGSPDVVFYGASKDFVLLIESLDILLTKKLNISFIIDDYKTGFIDNIYNLNDAVYQPDGKVIPCKRKIKIVKSEEFFSNNKYNKSFKIITTSDANKNRYFQKLIDYGYKAQEDFFDYKEVASLLPLIKDNKTHIWRADIMLTEKCTLNCTFCNMYMPHFKNAKHRDLDEIKNDLDKFFNLIDYISIFHLVGGEPLMYPFVNEVIEYVGKKYRKKIGRLILTTNGTLTPKSETIKLFSKYNLLISISDYTDEVNYKRRINNLLENLKKNKITYTIRKDINWNDFGHPEVVKFPLEEEVKKHFKKCTAPYKGINKGRYYFCHLNTSANLAGLIPDNKNDYCDLDKINNLGLIEHDLGFLKLGYATFCKNCNGCNTGIEIPVGPGKQGIRISRN